MMYHNQCVIVNYGIYIYISYSWLSDIYIYNINNLIILIIIILLQLLLLLFLLLSGELSQFTNLKYGQKKWDNSRILTSIPVISSVADSSSQALTRIVSKNDWNLPRWPWRIDMEIPNGNPMEILQNWLWVKGHKGCSFCSPLKIAGVDVKIAPEIWKIIGNVIHTGFWNLPPT